MGLMTLSLAMASDLVFEAPQFRATIVSMPSSAAYISITNHGGIAGRLLAVESSLALKTELHTTDVSNGVMKMRQIDDGIAIPAGTGWVSCGADRFERGIACRRKLSSDSHV